MAGGKAGGGSGLCVSCERTGKNAFNSLVRLCGGSCLPEEALVSKGLYEVC